jgi:pteridine reductase
VVAPSPPVALITGAARRIGAAIARKLHGEGHAVVLHYHRSAAEAYALAEELNALRPDSALCLQADLLHYGELEELVKKTVAYRGRLDALIHNAANFFPTPLGQVTEPQWSELLDGNLKAPFFLTQAALPHLRETRGCVVTLLDIHGQRGLADHPVYSLSKAGLASMTQILARELAPLVRINGLALGAILWPEGDADAQRQEDILHRIPLGRCGSAEEVAEAVWFLVANAPYVTGQVLHVDGGRGLVD